ncbi:hypothetical protein HDU86_002785 [Geranomyces michiganensis]|nr:hypothetical protein HDU86_002785 [Geranomyces michiganensis]
MEAGASMPIAQEKAQYVTKSVPEDLDMFQRLDRVGRILSTTEVRTIISAEVSDSRPDDYQHRVKWRASVMLVHQLTKTRREAYIKADSVYRPRALKKALIYWLQHQRSTRVYKAQAIKMAMARERNQLVAAFMTWRRVIERLDERKENARIAYRFNLMNNAVRHWRLGMETRAEEEKTAGAAHQIARLMQTWNFWRNELIAKRLAVKKLANKELAARHRQSVLLCGAFRAMRETYVNQRDLREASAEFRTNRRLRECLHIWLYKASHRILLAQADATAAQLANSNIQKRTMAAWIRRSRLAVAGQSLANLIAARMLTRYFVYWKLRGYRKLQIARKMDALRRLRTMMLKHRCRTILQAWNGLVEQGKHITVAQARFAQHLYAIHGIPPSDVAEDVTRVRNLVELRTAFARWRAGRFDKMATRIARASDYQRRWNQWVYWVAERKLHIHLDGAGAVTGFDCGDGRSTRHFWRKLPSVSGEGASFRSVIDIGLRERGQYEREEMAACARRVDVAVSTFVRWKFAAAARARNRTEERKRARWLELADKRYRHRILRGAITLWLRRFQRARRLAKSVDSPPSVPSASSAPRTVRLGNANKLRAPIPNPADDSSSAKVPTASESSTAGPQATLVALHAQARTYRGRRLILRAWNVWRTMAKLRAFEGCRKMV